MVEKKPQKTPLGTRQKEAREAHLKAAKEQADSQAGAGFCYHCGAEGPKGTIGEAKAWHRKHIRHCKGDRS